MSAAAKILVGVCSLASYARMQHSWTLMRLTIRTSKSPPTTITAQMAMIDLAVKDGIEDAAHAVTGWDQRDYKIAETAARGAIASLRQREAEK